MSKSRALASSKAYTILGFDQVLKDLADFSQSEEAKERLSHLSPSTDRQVVEKRLAETTEAVRLITSGQKLPFLSLASIHQLLNQVSKGYVLTGQEVEMVADFLRSCRMGRHFFKKIKNSCPS